MTPPSCYSTMLIILISHRLSAPPERPVRPRSSSGRPGQESRLRLLISLRLLADTPTPSSALPLFLTLLLAMDEYSATSNVHLDRSYRPLSLPAPASALRFACDEAQRAFRVRLVPNTDLSSRWIDWGMVIVRDNGGELMSYLRLGRSQFPPISSITLYAAANTPPAPGLYSVEIRLRWAPEAQEQADATEAAQPSQEADVPEDIEKYARLATSALASLCSSISLADYLHTGFCRNGTPHDVCIDFAHVGLQLWGNQKRLSKQSPYFRVLLRNKDIETSTMHPPIMPPHDWAWDQYYGDSDDERDIPYVRRGLPGQKRSIGFMRKMKMVRIDDSAYSTFLAVLVWMETGLIFLAPLTPEPRPPITLQPLPLQSAMVDPPVVSPKSVFRVAKLLELENLAELAMARILAQITPQNAIPQLYAQSSRQHADIIDNLVDYVVENWPDVLREEQAAGDRLRSLGANPSLQEVTMHLRRALTQRGIVAAV
ncbi:hypothetical protein AAT19DRAFT_8472 [Rhodotorula toruloides]|uniref:BTB domain-containing protein n=1 Tax=Rhodotorula toruloides TaxID=5286 RepID=A0A2T0AHD6_RHOTO|nr:hypothetical protein AAT19DRAFT_8472 [Rhodotorula toruloides]